MNDLKEFDPTVAELTAIVESTKNITAENLEDKTQLVIVKESRISIRDARLRITTTGKKLRADALTYQRAVITKEKELLEILAPEEERLANILVEAKEIADRKKRVKALPGRNQKILEIGDGLENVSDNFLLGMDDKAFTLYVEERKTNKLEADRLEVERKQKELDAKEAKLNADQEKHDAVEKARLEERESNEREKLAEQKARIAEVDAEEKRKLEEKLEADKKARFDLVQNFKNLFATFNAIEEFTKFKKTRAGEVTEVVQDEVWGAYDMALKRVKADQEKLAKRTEFNEWLKEIGYNKETDILKPTDSEVRVFRLLGTFKK